MVLSKTRLRRLNRLPDEALPAEEPLDKPGGRCIIDKRRKHLYNCSADVVLSWPTDPKIWDRTRLGQKKP